MRTEGEKDEYVWTSVETADAEDLRARDVTGQQTNQLRILYLQGRIDLATSM